MQRWSFSLLPSTPVRCDTPVLAHPSSPISPSPGGLSKGRRRPSGALLTSKWKQVAYVPGVNCMTEGSNLERERDPDLSGNQSLSINTSPSDGQETLSKSFYTLGLQFFFFTGFWGEDSERWIWWCTGNMARCFCFYYYSMYLAFEIQMRLHCIGLASILVWRLQIQKQWGPESYQYCGENDWV